MEEINKKIKESLTSLGTSEEERSGILPTEQAEKIKQGVELLEQKYVSKKVLTRS